ncbi:MAG: hypothetical protein K0S53_2746 [Bacteroidetes bacterium]|jgi:hypothetical protein|nr:hypothetical protein [Bacteroidota bacterium]MDF2451565.1 hypothetical protein [Bacteroidota bacterium]
MDKEDDTILGYIKYEGGLVSDGYLDARKSGETLLGIDEVLRYFIYQENPQIQGFEFEIPVRIRKGSWITTFPENPEKWAAGAFTLWMAGKYAGSALEEIAKNDFKNVSLKEVFKKAFIGAISVIKVAKHFGSISKKKFDKIEFDENNELIKIINDDGEELWIPPEMLELYSNCPQSIFNKMTKLIEEERELVVGLHDENVIIEEKITVKNKYIFTKPDEEDEIILPELKHGEYIEIQGHVTRGNEKANTIGFLYSDHIITCYPQIGNIKENKNNLFNNCLLKGYVNREDKNGKLIEKRPRIAFVEIINLDKPGKSLFD